MTTVATFPRSVERLDPVWIPLKDGARLAARIWRPADAESIPVPAILEYIPYRRRDLTAQRDALTHPYVAGHGYACVRVDMRGSGDSDGVLTDEYLALEQDDAVEVIAWLAAQPWCTGAVGMMGHSWGGFNALQVAARLSDVAPGGAATRVTYGLLNLTHRESHAEPAPLEPGRRYRVRVALNDVAQTFPVGHRIRLAGRFPACTRAAAAPRARRGSCP